MEINVIISDIVRILCLSFIILHCHQRIWSQMKRCKWPCKRFYCVLCDNQTNSPTQNTTRLTNTNPTRTPVMNPGTVRRVNRYTYTSLMKKNQKKSCICSLDGYSFLYLLKLLTEIMMLLSVPSYTVKQKYDTVDSITWSTIYWVQS